MTTEAAAASEAAGAAGVFRSGFACVVGRPNAGKSTLVNALVGQKVAIASARPQTTRHTIRGIVTRPDAQLVLVDTPGLHKPRTTLGERLNALVRDTWGEVDVVAACFPCDQRVGPGDRYLIGELGRIARGGGRNDGEIPGRGKKILRFAQDDNVGGARDDNVKFVALATKSDLVTPERLRAHLLSLQQAGDELGVPWAHIVPVSALTGDQVDEVADVLFSLLPPGPRFYPEGETTDEPAETVVAELIREAALELVDDELPHSIAVVVEEMGPRADRPADRPLLDIYASIVVERDSQKPIVLGARAERLKRIGTAAREQIARLFGTPVYLDLRVKVLKEWQRDAKKLARLGF
jgi:GTP-binding protein Era